MALLSGALLLTYPATIIPENRLQVWTFARAHFDAYREAIPGFERDHAGLKVDLQYVHERAVTSRLRAAFASDLPVPDMLEVEIRWAGGFFRGPLSDIGFVDLTRELKKPRPDGPPWFERVVASRFAPYTARRKVNGIEEDHIFGLPHDVHPVLLAYRRDIFEEHGIDVEKLTTWDAFFSEGRKLLKKLNGDGQTKHFLIELNDASSEHFEILLFQRGGALFAPDGTLRMDDETAIQNMLWYVPLVAGHDRVAYSLAWNLEMMGKAQESKLFLAVLMPDWLSGYYQKYAPAAHGKMALMPLPAFTPGGLRTSTRGGSMMGFSKKSKQFDNAWELALKLYYDTDSRIEQFKLLNILPPTRESWKHPALSAANPYFSNQPLGRLYADQAESTPPQYASPYAQIARRKLGEALSESVRYYSTNGVNGFEDYVRHRMKQAGDEVRIQSTLNAYD